MSDFDFIKAFGDVSLLEVEAVGKIVGRAIASAHNGMIEAGLSEEAAVKIIRGVFAEFFVSFNMRPPS